MPMEVEFEDERLKRLEAELDYTAGWELGIVRTFRMRMQLIRNAPDERDFYALKSLHFEKLKADLAACYSMRLNVKWRLILKFRKEDSGKVVVVISIMDYH
jgi:toxin HigB-1